MGGGFTGDPAGAARVDPPTRQGDSTNLSTRWFLTRAEFPNLWPGSGEYQEI